MSHSPLAFKILGSVFGLQKNESAHFHQLFKSSLYVADV